MNIVLIAPSGSLAPTLDRLELLPEDTVTVVTWSPPDTDRSAPIDAIVLERPVSDIAHAVTATLSTSVIGRNLLRLTWLDGGRRLARHALRDARVRGAVSRADLVAVLERDGILTGWHAVRRWARDTVPAAYGPAAAHTLLSTMRA